MLNLASKLILLTLALVSSSAQAEVSIVSTLDYALVPDKQVRYLPNYSTEYPFSKVTERFTFNANNSLSYNLRYNLEASYSALDKPKVNRAYLSYNQESLQYSVGIVPYRISWCRSDKDSPFIHDANNFCSYQGLAEMSSSATGVQVAKSIIHSEYITDFMLSAYKPSIDEQDKSLVIYKAVGKNTRHDKVGISFNQINFVKDTQIRVSALRSWQNQESIGSYERMMQYDTYYLGYEMSLTDKIETRLSSSAYIGQQRNPRNLYTFRSISNTIDVIYKLDAKHKVAIGFNNYSNKTKYDNSRNPQRVQVISYHLAYRYEVNKNTYLITQLTKSYDYSITKDKVITDKQGNSLSLRLGFSF